MAADPPLGRRRKVASPADRAQARRRPSRLTTPRVRGNISRLQEGACIPAPSRSLPGLGGYRLLGLIGLGAVTARLAHSVWLHRPLLIGGDLDVYAAYASRIAAGQIPYRDFPIEYPPLSLLAFLLPRLATPLAGAGYPAGFVLLMLLLAAAIGVAAARTEVRLTGSSPGVSSFLVFAAGSILLAPVMLRRYDLLPAACTGLALLALLGGRSRASGWWLGLGVVAKLYPAVVVPIFCAERLARRDGKGASALVQGGLLAGALTVLPFALLFPPGLWRTWSYHVERGLQVESVAGGLVLLAARLGWTPVSIVEAFGADQVVNDWTPRIAGVLPVATALSVGLLTTLAYQRFRQDHAAGRDTGPAVVGYTMLVLLAFMLTSKVLSPQYLVWTLPLLPLLPRRRALCLLGAYGLTAVVFPWLYWSLVSLEWPGVAGVNLRNGVLVLLAIALVRDVRPAAGGGTI